MSGLELRVSHSFDIKIVVSGKKLLKVLAFPKAHFSVSKSRSVFEISQFSPLF